MRKKLLFCPNIKWLAVSNDNGKNIGQITRRIQESCRSFVEDDSCERNFIRDEDDWN